VLESYELAGIPALGDYSWQFRNVSSLTEKQAVTLLSFPETEHRRVVVIDVVANCRNNIMAEEGHKKGGVNVEINFQAESQNWEARCKGELEAPRKWAETWGELFVKEVPVEYEARVKYLQSELKKIPPERRSLPPKYGVGAPFPEVNTGADFKRKKLNFEPNT
jgi:hypothetical protein